MSRNSSIDTTPVCVLCGCADTLYLTKAHSRRFYSCPCCRLIFVSPEDRLPPDEERSHYATHENDPYDPGYRAFLSRLADPLVRELPQGATGLDYGSGPGPALAKMLRDIGFTMEVYDPFFAPAADALARTYDFVTCTETAEHFHHPAKEFRRLNRLVRPGGWIAVMTEWPGDEVEIETWRYARDPTHVVFYRRETMVWLAEAHGWSCTFFRKNVSIFQKKTR
ncbi:MAG: class I SAM-dependent methyltransferase [Bacteroidota bacterium]